MSPQLLINLAPHRNPLFQLTNAVTLVAARSLAGTIICVSICVCTGTILPRVMVATHRCEFEKELSSLLLWLVDSMQLLLRPLALPTSYDLLRPVYVL